MMVDVIPIAQKIGFEPDCIIPSGMEEGQLKPWMSYVNAIKLGVCSMSSLIKIGDTVIDMQEGNTAGMWTIGVVKSGNELGYTEEELLNGDQNIIDLKIDHAKQKLLAAGANFVADGVWDCLPIIDKIDSLIKIGIKP
jgi:phosphonoacetaldehyde hydrolase